LGQGREGKRRKNEGIERDEHEKAEHLKRKGRKWRRCR
jgi:hypothetical protein